MGQWMEKHKLVLRTAVFDQGSALPPHLLAEMLGEDLAMLYAWIDPRRSEAIPLDKFMKFTRISGDLRPLSLLCAALGGIFVPSRHSQEMDVNRCLEAIDMFKSEAYRVCFSGVKPDAARSVCLRRYAEKAQLAINRLLAAIVD